MPKLFVPVSRDNRRRLLDAYLAFLKERDGLPDVHACTLENREKVYDEYRRNPKTWDGPVPVDEFWKLYQTRGADAGKGSSEMALWMSILARINAGEKYGVELGIRRYKTEEPDLEEPITYTEMEEFYHTHILGDALRVLGVNVTILPPGPVTRAFVYAIATLPKVLAFPLILVAETVATLVFAELWKTAVKLFGDGSEAGKRIIWLVEQILVDEAGHVALCQAKVGPFGMWIARRILPLMGKAMMADDPCIGALYDTREVLRKARDFDWDMLPPAVRARAFVPELPAALEPAPA